VTPPAPYEYSRELADLADAIKDLEASSGTTLDVGTPRAELEAAFASACKGEQVSCDVSTWLPAWTPKSDSARNLAHALGDADRVYTRFAASFNPHLTDATIRVEAARREIRELLVIREHLAFGPHLPAGRQALYLLDDLKYVRALIGDDLPPADDPWDCRGTVTLLDSVIAIIDGAHIEPDKQRVETIVPDPADFASLSYPLRMRVAHDIIERAYTDYEQAGALEALELDHRSRIAKPIHQVSINLDSADPHKAAAPQ
jgi:hypothetical protein